MTSGLFFNPTVCIDLRDRRASEPVSKIKPRLFLIVDIKHAMREKRTNSERIGSCYGERKSGFV